MRGDLLAIASMTTTGFEEQHAPSHWRKSVEKLASRSRHLVSTENNNGSDCFQIGQFINVLYMKLLLVMC